MDRPNIAPTSTIADTKRILLQCIFKGSPRKNFTRSTIQSARVNTAQKKLVDHQLRFVNALKKTTFPPTPNQAASPLALRILNFQTHHWRSNSLSGYLAESKCN